MLTLHVMVCDDEPGMRMGVARALRDFVIAIPDVDTEIHFAVDQAESGEQALERISASAPDILLLDHKLPGISGIDVLDQMAAKPLDMLTIMITAYASIETAVRATKKGSYDYLPKPFTPAELRSTLQKAAEHLLLSRQARQLAQEKRQVRFQFISVLAHELKAPINAVEGYLNVMRERTAGDDPAVYDQILDRCLTRTAFMRKMINDLLDLTRIESGQKKREMAEVDLREVARTAMDTALPEAAKRGITIALEAPEPVVLWADRGEVEIVLNNLVSNAVKYNRDGGHVDVSLADQGDRVSIRVSDTGIGLSQEEAGRLFADFVRIKNEKTRAILGSGLGLSTVKKVAMLYGGDVRVQSEPDVGSTFTVTLERSPAPAVAGAST